MLYPCLIAGFFGFLFILQCLVTRLEKRLVWSYGELQPDPPFGDPTGYGMRSVTGAVRNGFTFLGWAPDLKGKNYRVSYAFIVSPGLDTVGIIGVGHVLSMPVKGTWLHTPEADGQRSWYSTDNQACVEIDLLRDWRSHLVSAGGFLDLWQQHQAWLEHLQATPRRFNAHRAVEEFRKFREDHYHAMARRRLITFLDASESWWRYTTYGAAKVATYNFSIGLLRAFTFGRFPKGA